MLFNLACYKKPYLRKIRTKIKKIKDNLILLEENIFFPGAGGQARDSGQVNGLKIADSIWENSELWLKVPHHQFSEGEEVELEIAWSRRYQLMKAHTAEHLFVRSLTELLNESITLHKIEINPTSAKVVIVGNVSWSEVSNAVIRVNQWINDRLSVQDDVMLVESAKKLSKIRARWDRIDSDEVRVVKIGLVDVAACKGLHVHNTREIKMFAVKKINHERIADETSTIIEFLVGEEAAQELLRHHFVLGEIRELFSTTSLKHLPSTLQKVIIENQAVRKSLKVVMAHSLKQDHVLVLNGGIKLIIYVFQDIIPKELSKIALNEIRRIEARTILALLACDRQEKKWHFQFLKSKAVPISLKDCLIKAVSGKIWKGGGNEHSFSGILEWEGNFIEVIGRCLKECCSKLKSVA